MQQVYKLCANENQVWGILRVNRIKPLTVLISVWTERQKNDIILKDLRVLRQSDLCPDDALARV